MFIFKFISLYIFIFNKKKKKGDSSNFLSICKMKCVNQLRFLIISINSILSISTNLNKFALFKLGNEKNFKFIQNFENSYLLKNFQVREDNSFKLLNCLLLSSKNNLTKSVSYELTNNTIVNCKSYSSYLKNSSQAEISLSPESRIFSKSRDKIYVSTFNEVCNQDDFICNSTLSCNNGFCQCSSGE